MICIHLFKEECPVHDPMIMTQICLIWNHLSSHSLEFSPSTRSRFQTKPTPIHTHTIDDHIMIIHSYATLRSFHSTICRQNASYTHHLLSTNPKMSFAIYFVKSWNTIKVLHLFGDIYSDPNIPSHNLFLNKLHQ